MTGYIHMELNLIHQVGFDILLKTKYDDAIDLICPPTDTKM